MFYVTCKLKYVLSFFFDYSINVFYFLYLVLVCFMFCLLLSFYDE